jgi:hypothetical protein
MNQQQAMNQNKDSFIQSPIITPIKSKLFNNSNQSFFKQPPLPPLPSESNDQNQNNSFKTPKQTTNQSLLFQKATPTIQQQQQLLLPQQQEYKSVRDSTGSRFSVKLNDNRLVRVNLNESSTCKLVSMCLEAFKYALNKDIYYEIIQQWYIHRYTAGDQSIRDQLNLFFYLILNLCGCLDMACLEQQLSFLINNNNWTKTTSKSDVLITTIETDLTKRSKSSNNSVEMSTDWEFLLNDNSINKNLFEFNFNDLVNKLPKLAPISSNQMIRQESLDSASAGLPPTGLRIKRSIGLTSNNSTKPLLSNTSGSGGGLLFPYLKHILYVMH